MTLCSTSPQVSLQGVSLPGFTAGPCRQGMGRWNSIYGGGHPNRHAALKDNYRCGDWGIQSKCYRSWPRASTRLCTLLPHRTIIQYLAYSKAGEETELVTQPQLIMTRKPNLDNWRVSLMSSSHEHCVSVQWILQRADSNTDYRDPYSLFCAGFIEWNFTVTTWPKSARILWQPPHKSIASVSPAWSERKQTINRPLFVSRALNKHEQKSLSARAEKCWITRSML